jgi:choline kinase
MYKVLIASAGLGTRLGNLCKNMNKALVSIAHRPAISYIIDKFPEDTEIVIAVGYKKELVKQFISIAYPDRPITFVDIDPFEGEGSGLGFSILQCKDLLQCPFVFVPNDTFVLDEIPDVDVNWMGFAFSEDIENYRTIRKKHDIVTALLEKKSPGMDLLPYIGLAGIRDYEIFWNAMENGRKFGSITEGESYGLKELIKTSVVKAVSFDWYDIGNLTGLALAQQYFQNVNDYNILPKIDEAIWFVNDLVIKYSADKKFISNRVHRATLLDGFVPPIVISTANMYAYKQIKGNVLSKNPNVSLFRRFLKTMEYFWYSTADETGEDLDLACYKFYKEKTIKRVTQYLNRFGDQQDTDDVINGTYVPNIDFIFNKLDWDYLATGIYYRVHGDLHFENILLGEDGKFYLLDWRQEFEGKLEYFDIYYDLAKLYHGLIVSHEKVFAGEFSLIINENIIEFDIPISIRLVECQKLLDGFILSYGYDLKKIKLLTALVFLNNAPLHHEEYAKFLFYLGKYLLWKEIH